MVNGIRSVRVFQGVQLVERFFNRIKSSTSPPIARPAPKRPPTSSGFSSTRPPIGCSTTRRSLAPKTSFWCHAQFVTLRLAFVKIAARIIERITLIKVSLPSSYLYKPSFARLPHRAVAMPP